MRWQIFIFQKILMATILTLIREFVPAPVNRKLLVVSFAFLTIFKDIYTAVSKGTIVAWLLQEGALPMFRTFMWLMRLLHGVSQAF